MRTALAILAFTLAAAISVLSIGFTYEMTGIYGPSINGGVDEALNGLMTGLAVSLLVGALLAAGASALEVATRVQVRLAVAGAAVTLLGLGLASMLGRLA